MESSTEAPNMSIGHGSSETAPGESVDPAVSSKTDGGASRDGIRSANKGSAATSAATGRWSEAILATGLSWARMDRSARIGQTQIRSRANRGKKAGKVRGAGDLPSLP